MDGPRTDAAPTPQHPDAPQATAAASGVPAERSAHETTDEKPLATVAYLLTWITGLIIFLVVKKEQRYARWHAVQAIGLGIAVFAVAVVLNVLSASLLWGPGGFALAGLFSLLWFAFSIGVLIVIILAAVKAYKGETFRIPVIADFADKYA